MKATRTISVILACAPRTAHAGEPPSRVGVTAVIGAGVTGFTDSVMRDVAGASLTWDARVAVGSQLPIALEVGYLGSDVALPGMQDCTLEVETIDAAARYNIAPRARLAPYVLLGVGWQRFVLVGAPAASGMRTSNSSLVVPVALGVQLRVVDGLLIDVRGTYRASQAGGMVADASMNAWDATVSLGAEL
jgi:hypothetical protein